MDKTLKTILSKEKERQENWLEMIASENYVSKDVMESLWNYFTNKYSEWYPWKRYYWWQEYVDMMENITQYRALRVFDLIEEKNENKIEEIVKWLKECNWGVNVQPLSWSPANLAVYLGVLNPWDTILWMDLSCWWHLSHWFKLSSSWIYYNIVSYGVDKESEKIDFAEVEEKALLHKPKLILAWYSAYTREIEWEKFKSIQQRVFDKHWYYPILMLDMAHIAWIIAAWLLWNPFKYFDIITTTTHKTLRWPRWAMIFFDKTELNRNWSMIQLEKNINRWVFPWVQWWPHINSLVAKSVAFNEILKNNKKDWKVYIKNVLDNALVLADELKRYWWKLISWWTDNHIVLVDVTKIKEWFDSNFNDTWLTWKDAEETLDEVLISINKNWIPFDTKSPLNPSWIRLWTPAITTRWILKKEIELIAFVISKALLLKAVYLKDKKESTYKKWIKELKNIILWITTKFKLYS